MAYVEYTVRWVDSTFFDADAKAYCTIKSIESVLNKGKTELVATLTSPTDERRLSIWGQNLKNLILKYGNETDAWIGKSLVLMEVSDGGKTKRIILP